MKLNKPPISEEKTVLEEYVDFLLTDLSNVTPIRSKASASKKPGTISEVILEIPSAGSSTAEINNLQGKKQPAKQGQSEPRPNWLALEENDPQKGGKRSQIATVAASAIEEQQEIAEDNSENSDDHTPPLIVAESEEEELMKWNAVLAREKEQKNLLQRAAVKNQVPALAKISINTKIKSKKIVEEKSSWQQTIDQPAVEMSQRKIARSVVYDKSLPHKESDERLLAVEKLLARISLATKPVHLFNDINTLPLTPEAELFPEKEEFLENKNNAETKISHEAAQATFLQRKTLKAKDLLPDVFQTLIFNVGKLPLAVPLLKLGGIVQMSEQDITPLVGTPDWFMGLVRHNRGNLMVIDTQKYLMPEQSSLNSNDQSYDYLIILDDSNWALACHSVGDAKNLTQDDVRWSQKSSKRPWFGGMVVEYMSALIEVDELINMLANNIVE